MDFTAFHSIPSKDAVAAYITAHPEQQQYSHKDGEYILDERIKRYKFAMWSVMAVLSVSIIVLGPTNMTNEEHPVLLYLLWILVVTVLGGVMWIQFRKLMKDRQWTAWRIAVQLNQFASDNGFRHIRDEVADPSRFLKAGNPNNHYLKTNAISSSRFEVATVTTYNSNSRFPIQQYGYIKLPRPGNSEDFANFSFAPDFRALLSEYKLERHRNY